jgi:hypothetical protein
MTTIVRNSRVRLLASLALLVPCALAAAGGSTACSADNAGDDGMVRANVAVIGQSRQALSTSVASIAGTYSGDCGGHTNGDAWVVNVNGSVTTNLSVQKNDSDCDLAVTHVYLGTTGYQPFVSGTASPIALATSYPGSGKAFRSASGDPIKFYANAMITSLSFATDFQITVNLSDDPTSADAGTKNAAFQMQVGTATQSNVLPPSYSVDFSSMTIQKDNGNLVDSTADYATLTLTGQAGQDYAVYAGAYDSTTPLATLEGLFTGATYMGSLPDPLHLPAADFTLDGLDLDNSPIRSIVIRNTVNGVSSFQIISVTFIP